MEQQKLPNATISLVLGITSFIACCISWGIGGILLSGIGLFLANKDKKIYEANPENYTNYNLVKTSRTISIIGLILATLMLLLIVGLLISLGGIEGMKEWQQELISQAEKGA